MSNTIHYTRFNIGTATKFITQVRNVLNNYYDSSEVSDTIIYDFLSATRADYNYQTNSSVSDWDSETVGLNYTIARVTALYIAIGLLSRAFSGGNASYRIGNFEIDRKDTIDMINFFKNMAERSAIKYGFHPSQGTVLADITTSEITTDDIVLEW